MHLLRQGRRIVRGTLLTLGIAALCAPGAGAQPAQSGCQATPDAAFDQLWSRSGAGWTGGDGTYSVRLPDARTAWIFGDTFLGGVRGDGSRAPASAFVHNSLVVQGRGRRSGRALESVMGQLRTRAGAEGRPRAFLAPPRHPRRWFWPGAGLVERGRLRLMLSEFRASGGSLWNFRHTGDAVATFSLPRLKLRSVRPVAAGGGTTWGVALGLRRDAQARVGERSAPQLEPRRSDRRGAHGARDRRAKRAFGHPSANAGYDQRRLPDLHDPGRPASRFSDSRGAVRRTSGRRSPPMGGRLGRAR